MSARIASTHPLSTPARSRGPALAWGIPKVCLLVALALTSHALPARAETGQQFADQARAGLVGREVPPLVLTTIDGKRIDLAALRGHKAVYLKFWATWCSPCREQMPHFERTQQSAGDDLEVVAINIGFDDSVEQIRAVQREFGLTMPIVRDDGQLAQVFGLRVTPQHILIGKDGRVAYVGHLVDARLQEALAAVRAGPASVGAAAAPAVATSKVAVAAAPTLVDVDGEPIALADASGRPTRIAFFAPWCEGYFVKTRPQASAQCRALRERFAALRGDSGERWIAVSLGVWTSADDVRAYRDENHLHVPLALDSDGALFRRYGVRSVPAVIEVDGQGRVLRHIALDGKGAANPH